MGEHEADSPTLSNQRYDQIKSAVQVYLPGLGALYFTIAQIWGLPYAEEVVGTIAALSLFLGLGLRKASGQYDERGDGVIEITELDDKIVQNIRPNYDPYQLQRQDQVVLKVHDLR